MAAASKILLNYKANSNQFLVTYYNYFVLFATAKKQGHTRTYAVRRLLNMIYRPHMEVAMQDGQNKIGETNAALI